MYKNFFLFFLPISLLMCHLITGINHRYLGIDPLEHLSRVEGEIEAFKAQFNTYPKSLSELHVLHHDRLRVSPYYDSYGQKLQYVTIDAGSYFLKSFGRDGQENTGASAVDATIIKGINPAKRGIQSMFLTDSRLNFYQPAFLAGLQAPHTGFVAELHVNPSDTTRRLLIRHPDRPRFIMSPPHDEIEEFLWLPSGFEMIYTATNSAHYEDGLYYWNIKTNVQYNFLEDIAKQHFPKSDSSTKYLISLSHVNRDPLFIYFFATILDSDSISPKEFYSYKNYFALKIPASHLIDVSIEKISAEEDFTIFDYNIAHDGLVDLDSLEDANVLQKEWLSLSLKGELETTIGNWQTFCGVNSKSPLFPYALWWLASIYSDAYATIVNFYPSQALVLRNFGIEISHALASQPEAPSYKRAMAEYLKQRLLSSRPANYTVFSDQIQPF